MATPPYLTLPFTVPPCADFNYLRSQAVTFGAELAERVSYIAATGSDDARDAAAQFEPVLCRQMIDLVLLRHVLVGLFEACADLPLGEWLCVTVHDTQAANDALTNATRVGIRLFTGTPYDPAGTRHGWLQIRRIPRDDA